jgi:phosphopantothenoylcysteine decarboxylase/phosphopantothenate--cysteine ligase
VASPSPLRGRGVVITSGPTREHMDPIRFMTNGSSGKMGAALAKAALSRGAKVTVISGPVAIEYPKGVEIISVTTALEMHAETLRRARRAAAVIGAAAVSDWRFARASEQKIKRKPGRFSLTMVPNPDIMAAVGKRKKKGQVVVGFALETQHRAAHAARKLRAKHLDAIVANGPSSLGGSVSEAVLLTRGDHVIPLGRASKDAQARKIVREIERLLEERAA